MKIEATFIGEYTEEDFRSKGLVFEAENGYDSAYIKYFIENPKELEKLIYNSRLVMKVLEPKERLAPNSEELIMSVNGRDWVPYDRKIHSDMVGMGFQIKIKRRDS